MSFSWHMKYQGYAIYSHRIVYYAATYFACPNLSWKRSFCKKYIRKLWSNFDQHARPSVCNSPHCKSFWKDCWCGLRAVNIIGSFFFENNREMFVTVNSERYLGMLTDFLWPKLNWINLLVSKFGEQINGIVSSIIMDKKFWVTIIICVSYLKCIKSVTDVPPCTLAVRTRKKFW